MGKRAERREASWRTEITRLWKWRGDGVPPKPGAPCVWPRALDAAALLGPLLAEWPDEAPLPVQLAAVPRLTKPASGCRPSSQPSKCRRGDGALCSPSGGRQRPRDPGHTGEAWGPGGQDQQQRAWQEAGMGPLERGTETPLPEMLLSHITLCSETASASPVVAKLSPVTRSAPAYGPGSALTDSIRLP